MTRKKRLQNIEAELRAINICIEENNIQIKPIIRVFLNRIELILKGKELYPLNKTIKETEKSAFNIH